MGQGVQLRHLVDFLLEHKGAEEEHLAFNAQVRACAAFKVHAEGELEEGFKFAVDQAVDLFLDVNDAVALKVPQLLDLVHLVFDDQAQEVEKLAALRRINRPSLLLSQQNLGYVDRERVARVVGAHIGEQNHDQFEEGTQDFAFALLETVKNELLQAHISTLIEEEGSHVALVLKQFFEGF